MQSKLFTSMMPERESYLDRGRLSSSLTIPYLVLRRGHTHTSYLPQPWESTGGFLLNNLANKIMQSIFPVGLPWIRFDLVASIEEELSELPDAEHEDLLQQINTRLSQMERTNFTRQVLKDGDPAVLARCIIQLLVQGNYSMQILENGKLKGRPLTRYVTERDAEGTVTYAVIEDSLAYGKLDPDVQMIVAQSKLGMNMAQFQMDMDLGDIEIYTHINLGKDGRYMVWQEVMGQTISDSTQSYALEDLPYLFPVLILIDGEHYGRGYVDNYCGDLTSLDAMSETVQRGTAAAAKLVALNRPGGVTSKEAYQRAVPGDMITGVANDITYPSAANKSADFNGSLQVQDRIINRLNTAFLFGVGNIRQAERVTAKEIQFLAQALEEQLGTSYTELVRTLQMPYARGKVRAMQANGNLPSFSLEQIDISILTGAAALTRQSKTQALLQGLSVISQLAPENFRERLDVDTLVNIVSEGDGYSYAGVMKTEEAVMTERRERLAEETLSQQLQNQQGQQPPQQPQQPQPQPQPVT